MKEIINKKAIRCLKRRRKLKKFILNRKINKVKKYIRKKAIKVLDNLTDEFYLYYSDLKMDAEVVDEILRILKSEGQIKVKQGENDKNNQRVVISLIAPKTDDIVVKETKPTSPKRESTRTLNNQVDMF